MALKDAFRWLDTDETTGLSRLVTPSQAQEVISAMIGRDEPCGVKQGEQAARMLMGFYPAREVNDPAAFARGMTAMMAAYPLDFVRRVVDPVNGLPSRLKWLPTLADVKAALEQERARRARIWANANHILNTERQRQAQLEEDARIEQGRPSADERARQVSEALKNGLRPMVECAQ